MKRRIPISKHLKRWLTATRGENCERCKKDKYDHIHHRDRNPSNNNPNNLTLLCMRCHQGVHDSGEDFVWDFDYDSDVFGGRILSEAEVSYILTRPQIYSKIVNFAPESVVELRAY